MPVKTPKKNIIRYNWIRLAVSLLIIILLAIVLVVPGVLRLIYRADSQVAMGNARSVRMASQVIATQQYGRNEAFCDVTREGGIADGLYEEIFGSFRWKKTDIPCVNLFTGKVHTQSGMMPMQIPNILCIIMRR